METNESASATQTHMQWRERESTEPPKLDLSGARKKIPGAVCGILLGALGVHKFILGYTKEGLIMLLATALTLGYGGFVTGIIGIIEGFIYLSKSDEQFVEAYVVRRRGWF